MTDITGVDTGVIKVTTDDAAVIAYLAGLPNSWAGHAGYAGGETAQLSTTDGAVQVWYCSRASYLVVEGLIS